MAARLPHTILFSWSPLAGGKASEEVSDVAFRLKSYCADPPVKWEVSVNMKMQKAKLPSHSGMHPHSAEPIPPIYFFRYPDCSSVCSLVSNKENKYSSDQVVCGDENMEKILTEYSHLIRRSLWKVTGQSYLLDTFVVSIGQVEQSNVSHSLILEVSYVGEDVLNKEALIESIYAVAQSLLPTVDDNVSSYQDSKSRDYGDFTLSDRCVQWMSCLKHITS